MDKEKIMLELEDLGISKENIKINEYMSKHTSFKIGGPADIFIKVTKIEEIKNIIKIFRIFLLFAFVIYHFTLY